MSSTIYDRVCYKYKLIDDVLGMSNDCNINSVLVRKDKWTTYMNKQDLDSQIRTPQNPTGIIQVQEFNPSTNEIYYDSIKYVTQKPNFPEYSRMELSVMGRDELIEICRFYGIDYSHKVDKFLVKYILEKQKILFPNKNNVESITN